ncbi:DEAD/DEAH box helicase [Lachnoclostridium sp. Marseille-P6806]|uniref:DEAD/DEAH box helicase n=1 Tax=Lachnoclostridium sp. Marseille-P6806 TaxID=2364793 RepID=UPI00102FE730|nr:DEAD/DEAH box helicase [Lachnoclostridium sp. Marseille-P6806]
MSFKELKLKRDIQSAVGKAGYSEPTPIQEKAIPEIIAGRDLIACAQTGTGKTAAFALPILNRLEEIRPKKIRALVLTPTRELAIQIFDSFRKYGRYLKLRTVCVYGGAKPGAQIAALERGCDILVATPGRLQDFMNSGYIRISEVEIFVLDEADRMLDMGFIGDVRKIASHLPGERQTVMFSATMPPKIEELAGELLTDPAIVKVAQTTDPADTVNQSLVFTEKVDKKHLLGDLLKKEEVKKSIVFTRTKHGADRLVRDLGKEGVAAIAIHGDKTQGQRQNALERFRSGGVKVLVATDVASRGIDIPKITHVFNYDLPMESESYIHRIGRAGRAGESGEAVTLCCEEELELLRDIEKMMKKEIPEIETSYSVPLERKAARAARRKSGADRRHSAGRGYGSSGAAGGRNSRPGISGRRRSGRDGSPDRRPGSGTSRYGKSQYQSHSGTVSV